MSARCTALYGGATSAASEKIPAVEQLHPRGEASVLLAYASVYGHTENAANVLAAKLVERGVRRADVRHLSHARKLHPLRRLPVQPPCFCRDDIQRRHIRHHGEPAARHRKPQSAKPPHRRHGKRKLGAHQRQADARHTLRTEGLLLHR